MCGIVAAVSDTLVAGSLVYSTLAMLQNRAAEAAGIAIAGGCQQELIVAKAAGKVYQALPDLMVPLLRGHSAIGHVRYSTNNGSSPKGAHPFHKGDVAVAHNGNLINTDELLAKLPKGTPLEFGSDTEIAAAMIGNATGDFYDRIAGVCEQLKGSYTLVVLSEDGTVAIARDPYGIRPASLGKWQSDDGDQSAVMAASETTYIHHIGGKLLPEVEPGEIVMIHPDRLVERRCFAECPRRASCIFELIYFARPSSEFFGVPCLTFRKALGAQLFDETGLSYEDDAVIVPILNSGLGSALGLEKRSGIPLDVVLINTGLSDRTFILPEQLRRELGVGMKHVGVRQQDGLWYIVDDDSMVRGTTIQPNIRILRRYNPRKITVAIPCPMFRHRCIYGIDTPSDNELIANRLDGDVDRIRQEIGADELYFLSLEGLDKVISSFGLDPDDFCKACFDGDYPVV